MSRNFPDWHRQERARTRWAGLTLGVALSMFVDGIVLHQLLQWHHMVSNVPPASGITGGEWNAFWDGVFLASAFVILVVGLLLSWRVASELNPAKVRTTLLGYVLLGFGGFNMVESIVDHWVLQLHHVREGVANWLLYDIGFFLIAGICIAAIGGWLIKVRSS